MDVIRFLRCERYAGAQQSLHGTSVPDRREPAVRRRITTTSGLSRMTRSDGESARADIAEG